MVDNSAMAVRRFQQVMAQRATRGVNPLKEVSVPKNMGTEDQVRESNAPDKHRSLIIGVLLKNHCHTNRHLLATSSQTCIGLWIPRWEEGGPPSRTAQGKDGDFQVPLSQPKSKLWRPMPGELLQGRWSV